MKLTCLGTASGIATKTRFHNMVLLESCGHGLLLDGGEPLSTLLIRHGTDLNEIDGMVRRARNSITNFNDFKNTVPKWYSDRSDMK